MDSGLAAARQSGMTNMWLTRRRAAIMVAREDADDR
jgi:hypothetical protein